MNQPAAYGVYFMQSRIPAVIPPQAIPKSVDTRWYQRLPHEDDIPVSHWEIIIVPERLFIRQTLANMQA